MYAAVLLCNFATGSNPFVASTPAPTDAVSTVNPQCLGKKKPQGN